MNLETKNYAEGQTLKRKIIFDEKKGAYLTVLSLDPEARYNPSSPTKHKHFTLRLCEEKLFFNAFGRIKA